MEQEKGFVYILTNESFKEDWVKIGKSSRPVDVRSKELDNTAVPLPFEIYATIQSVKYSQVERKIHKQIDRLSDLRIRPNREFFNIEPADALEILLDEASTLDDAVVCKYVNGSPVQIYPSISSSADTSIGLIKKQLKENDEIEKKHRNAGKPFKFEMIGLTVGDIITFELTGVQVRVAGSNKIEYGNRLYSMTAFTREFMPDERRLPADSYQGPLYFTYNGKTLVELRKEAEKIL